MNKILFGGSFDPIHLGHLHMAYVVHKRFDAEVIFLPSPISIWKNESAPFVDKVNMISLSIQNIPCFSISTFEGESGKKYNYSIDTVEYFVNLFPDDNFFYLIGADQVNDFHLWKDAESLSRKARIIFFKRDGVVVDPINVKKYNMIEVEGVANDISSTDIRNLRKLDITDEVIKYIEDNRLYYFKEIGKYLDVYRLDHSLEVAKLAYKIAKKHSFKCPQKAYIAGLLHDIAKKYPNSGSIMKESFVEYLDFPSCLHHQFVGSVLVKEVFRIIDEEIINSIKYHATGRDRMSELEMIIYASDKIEPTRKYDSSDLIKAMLQSETIEEGFIIVLKANQQFFIEKGIDYDNPLTKRCFEFYSK